MNRSFAIRGLAVFAALGFASGAVAQTAPGMGDLIGARGSSVESELQARGYEFATNLGSAALWWNAKTKACVSVAVDQGRVQSIQQASASDCGKSESHSSRAAAASTTSSVPADLPPSPSCRPVVTSSRVTSVPRPCGGTPRRSPACRSRWTMVACSRS